MPKQQKVEKEIKSWSKAIDSIFDRQQEVESKISPTVGEMRYILDFSRSLYETAQLMSNTSNMTHQGIIDFETAQKILDNQKKQMEKKLVDLQGYLKEE